MLRSMHNSASEQSLVVVVVVDFIFQQEVPSAHIYMGLICQGVLRTYRHIHTSKKRNIQQQNQRMEL